MAVIKKSGKLYWYARTVLKSIQDSEAYSGIINDIPQINVNELDSNTKSKLADNINNIFKSSNKMVSDDVTIEAFNNYVLACVLFDGAPKQLSKRYNLDNLNKNLESLSRDGSFTETDAHNIIQGINNGVNAFKNKYISSQEETIDFQNKLALDSFRDYKLRARVAEKHGVLTAATTASSLTAFAGINMLINYLNAEPDELDILARDYGFNNKDEMLNFLSSYYTVVSPDDNISKILVEEKLDSILEQINNDPNFVDKYGNQLHFDSIEDFQEYASSPNGQMKVRSYDEALKYIQDQRGRELYNIYNKHNVLSDNDQFDPSTGITMEKGTNSITFTDGNGNTQTVDTARLDRLAKTQFSDEFSPDGISYSTKDMDIINARSTTSEVNSCNKTYNKLCEQYADYDRNQDIFTPKATPAGTKISIEKPSIQQYTGQIETVQNNAEHNNQFFYDNPAETPGEALAKAIVTDEQARNSPVYTTKTTASDADDIDYNVTGSPIQPSTGSSVDEITANTTDTSGLVGILTDALHNALGTNNDKLVMAIAGTIIVLTSAVGRTILKTKVPKLLGKGISFAKNCVSNCVCYLENHGIATRATDIANLAPEIKTQQTDGSENSQGPTLY